MGAEAIFYLSSSSTCFPCSILFYAILFYSILLFLLLFTFATCLFPLGATFPMIEGRRGKFELQSDREEEDKGIYGHINHICACVICM